MNPYEIATRITMIDGGISAVLAGIMTKVLGLEGGIEKLSKSFTTLNRTSAFLAGGGLLAGATAIGGGLFYAAKAAAGLTDELAKLQNLNLKPGEFEKITNQAQKTIEIVRGTTLESALKGMNQLYSIVGVDDAARLSVPLAKYAKIQGQSTGNYEKATDDAYKLVQAGEMIGRFTNKDTGQKDIPGIIHFIELMSKMTQVSHNRVDSNMILGLAKQGAGALSSMTDEGLIHMAIAGQQMGGMRAGTAITSLYNQFIGGTMTKAKAAELKKLGLIGDFKELGGGLGTQLVGPNVLGQAMASDPMEAEKLISAAMSAHGITDKDAQARELFKILGRQTTQRLVHDFLRNEGLIEAETGRVERTHGMDSSVHTLDEKSYTQAMHNLESSWHNLIVKIGESEGVNKFLDGFSKNIDYVQHAVSKWPPGRMESITAGLGGLAIVMGSAGIVAMGLAIGPAGWLAGGLAALALVIRAYKPEWLHALARGVEDVLRKLSHFRNIDLHTINEAIDGAIVGFVDYMTSAISRAWAAIRKYVSGVLSGGSLLPNMPKWKLPVPPGGAGKGGGVPWEFNQMGYQGGRGGSSEQPIHIHFVLDGEDVASKITRIQMQNERFPGSAPMYNSHASYTSPDSNNHEMG